MANKKNKTNYEGLERVYTINVRKKVKVVPRYRKAEKAVKTIKEFVAKHMKVPDRELKNVRIDKYLNEYIWSRGIKNPPAKYTVKVKREKDIVKVELAEMPKNLDFKKKREEKRHSAEKKPAKKEKGSEQIQALPAKDAEAEKKKQKEASDTIVEAEGKIERAEHAEKKHETEAKKKTNLKKDHSKGKQGN